MLKLGAFINFFTMNHIQKFFTLSGTKPCYFLIILMAMGFLYQPAQAQYNHEKPLYLQYPTIPQFSVVTQDGKTFTQDDLKKNKPTLIFLFSCDCEHCQHETEEITQNIKKFRGTQILMVTHFPQSDMIAFYKNYHISQYPEITMATDAKRFLLYYYLLHYFPGLYIYNKKDQLVFHHEGTISVDTLAHYLKPSEY
jgi:thiol-disulfide isomerase/thioredoxin